MTPRCTPKSAALPLLLVLAFCGCQPKDYTLLHPLHPAPGILRESAIFDRGGLRIHWVAYARDARHRLPAVLIHPDKDGVAQDMEGICLALAQEGYFAAAVHYQRLEDLRQKNPLMAIRSFAEGTAAYQHLLEHPRVDPKRVGVLGFSRGGTQSLLLAALEPGVRVVVAYYPISDFDQWADAHRHSFPKSLWFLWVRRQITKAVGASSWEEALAELRTASPIHHAQEIRAPVLLIHGERDALVPLGQSQRLCEKLTAAGKSCELLTIPGGGHIFNFRDEKWAKIAWDKTLQFFAEHLKGQE